jgi:hypothetical protein
VNKLVRDVATGDFLTVDLGDPIDRIRGRKRPLVTVVVDAGTPVAVLHTKDVQDAKGIFFDVVRSRKPAILVPGEMTVEQAVTDATMRELDPAAAGAVVFAGTSLAGIWPATQIALAFAQFGSGSYGDYGSYGRVQVPRMAKPCLYTVGDRACGHPYAPRKRPKTFPPCPDPKGLGEHRIAW